MCPTSTALLLLPLSCEHSSWQLLWQVPRTGLQHTQCSSAIAATTAGWDGRQTPSQLQQLADAAVRKQPVQGVQPWHGCPRAFVAGPKYAAEVHLLFKTIERLTMPHSCSVESVSLLAGEPLEQRLHCCHGSLLVPAIRVSWRLLAEPNTSADLYCTAVAVLQLQVLTCPQDGSSIARRSFHGVAV